MDNSELLSVPQPGEKKSMDEKEPGPWRIDFRSGFARMEFFFPFKDSLPISLGPSPPVSRFCAVPPSRKNEDIKGDRDSLELPVYGSPSGLSQYYLFLPV
jgi:hypothetical protein